MTELEFKLRHFESRILALNLFVWDQEGGQQITVATTTTIKVQSMWFEDTKIVIAPSIQFVVKDRLSHRDYYFKIFASIYRGDSECCAGECGETEPKTTPLNLSSVIQGNPALVLNLHNPASERTVLLSGESILRGGRVSIQ